MAKEIDWSKPPSYSNWFGDPTAPTGWEDDFFEKSTWEGKWDKFSPKSDKNWDDSLADYWDQEYKDKGIYTFPFGKWAWWDPMRNTHVSLKEHSDWEKADAAYQESLKRDMWRASNPGWEDAPEGWGGFATDSSEEWKYYDHAKKVQYDKEKPIQDKIQKINDRWTGYEHDLQWEGSQGQKDRTEVRKLYDQLNESRKDVDFSQHTPDKILDRARKTLTKKFQTLLSSTGEVWDEAQWQMSAYTPQELVGKLVNAVMSNRPEAIEAEASGKTGLLEISKLQIDGQSGTDWLAKLGASSNIDLQGVKTLNDAAIALNPNYNKQERQAVLEASGKYFTDDQFNEFTDKISEDRSYLALSNPRAKKTAPAQGDQLTASDLTKVAKDITAQTREQSAYDRFGLLDKDQMESKYPQISKYINWATKTTTERDFPQSAGDTGETREELEASGTFDTGEIPWYERRSVLEDPNLEDRFIKSPFAKEGIAERFPRVKDDPDKSGMLHQLLINPFIDENTKDEVVSDTRLQQAATGKNWKTAFAKETESDRIKRIGELQNLLTTKNLTDNSWFNKGLNERIPNESQASLRDLFIDNRDQAGMSPQNWQQGKKPSLLGRPDRAVLGIDIPESIKNKKFVTVPAAEGGPMSAPTPLIRQLFPQFSAAANTASWLYQGADALAQARTGQTLAERLSNPGETFQQNAEKHKEWAAANTAKRDEMIGGVKNMIESWKPGDSGYGKYVVGDTLIDGPLPFGDPIGTAYGWQNKEYPEYSERSPWGHDYNLDESGTAGLLQPNSQSVGAGGLVPIPGGGFQTGHDAVNNPFQIQPITDDMTIQNYMQKRRHSGKKKMSIPNTYAPSTGTGNPLMRIPVGGMV